MFFAAAVHQGYTLNFFLNAFGNHWTERTSCTGVVQGLSLVRQTHASQFNMNSALQCLCSTADVVKKKNVLAHPLQNMMGRMIRQTLKCFTRSLLCDVL